MNKKILTSAAGIVAAAAVVGGATFAQWSDNWTESTANVVGADQLALSVTDPNPAQEFDKINMYPGGQADYEFFVTSRDGDAVPKADLTLTLIDLQGEEDGCTNTNGELDDDADCASTGIDAVGQNTFGEFDDDSFVVVNTTVNPLTAAEIAAIDPTATSICALNQTESPVTSRVVSGTSLRDLFNGGTLDLLSAGTTMGPDDSVCVRMAVGLDDSVDNASQGDSASFKVRFDLTQVI